MITNALLTSLRQIVHTHFVVTDEAACALYGTDGSGRYSVPGAVVLPGNEEEVSGVLRVLARSDVSVTVRGAATGVVGGAVPREQGVVLSLARLNAPVEVVAGEDLVVAPAGARLAEIEREAQRFGLWLGGPVAAYTHGTVGGALARNGDGLGGLTGTLSGLVHGFRAVMAKGGLIVAEWDGPQGQNTRAPGLLIGSEGSLGVITEVTLALRRRMPVERFIIASFKDPVVAADAGAAVIRAGVSPLLADVIDVSAWSRTGRWPGPETAEALLLIWLSGLEIDVEAETKWVLNICNDRLAHHTDVLPEAKARDIIATWTRVVQRSRPAPGQIPLDLSVPTASLPDLLQVLYDEARRLRVPVSGLARLTNGVVAMHVPVTTNDGDLYTRARELAERLSDRAHALRGTCLALHGVGAARLDLVGSIYREGNLDAMRAVKQVFDESDVFALSLAPKQGGERRDLRRRIMLEDRISEIREALSEQINSASSTGEPLQINAPSANTLSHIIRAARAHRIPVAIHERPPQRLLDISLSDMKRVSIFDPNSRVLAAEAGITLADIEEKARSTSLWWPVSPFISKQLPLGDLLAWEQGGAYNLGWGRLRDRVIGIEAVTGRGNIISWGGLAPMHHAGLRLSEVCLGARHRYAVITAAALHLSPLPAARACVSALFGDLGSAASAVGRWLGQSADEEGSRCRPKALCVLATSGAIGEYSDKVTAYVEFAGLPASVERQVRWAKHIADQNKGIDILDGMDDRADDMWFSVADVYQPCPPTSPGDTLHLVVWTRRSKWLILTRMIRHVVHAHGHPCRILTDVGSGRIDVRVENGAVEPAPLLRLLAEVVLKVEAMMEIRSSAFAGQWIGASSPLLEELAERLKLWLDPSGILPAGIGKWFETMISEEEEVNAPAEA